MIVFRCDSSFEIGTGHVMRCLHLAETLRRLGLRVEFVCLDLPGHVSSRISEQGFALHLLSPGSEDLRFLAKLSPPWIVVDHYGLDQSWESQLPSTTKIFVIDDLAQKKHGCHVLLNQNFYQPPPTYHGLVPSDCQLLLGPQFCLLNPTLQKASEARSVSKSPHVLVFFGGVDESGEMLKLLAASGLASSRLHFDFVALQSHKHLAKLQTWKLPSNVSLHVSPADWHQLLQRSDFFLGSGGTVTWERMYLGLPGAVIAVADNQERSARDLAEAGYQLYLGSSATVDYSNVISKLENLLFSQPAVVHNFSSLGLKLVNAFGPSQAQAIFGS